MLNYHVEKGTLPVLPGDYVYRIGTDHACTVRAVKVDAVILGKNDQITAKVNNEYGESEFGKHIFLTAEEAEEVAAKERPTPPYFFSDRAVQWMPVETWEPLNDTYYGVKVAQDDGSFKHQMTCFITPRIYLIIVHQRELVAKLFFISLYDVNSVYNIHLKLFSVSRELRHIRLAVP